MPIKDDCDVFEMPWVVVSSCFSVFSDAMF